jgi:uncharacterized protein
MRVLLCPIGRRRTRQIERLCTTATVTLIIRTPIHKIPRTILLLAQLACALVAPVVAAQDKATTPAPVEERSVPAAPATPPTEPSAEDPTQALPKPAGPAETTPAPSTSIVVPHIALLLPLKSQTYLRAAEAVKEGFTAAAEVPGAPHPLPIRVYEVDDHAQRLFDAYLSAIDLGAQIVVGPITRNGVTALAYSTLISVPTLGLNVPEGDAPLPKPFYSLSLSQEAEARQIAHIAFNAGQRRAATVTSESPFNKRLQSAFAQEWRRQGGVLALEYVFSADSKSLAEFRAALRKETVEVVFLALDPTEASRIRPYIRPTLPTWASSQIFRSKQNMAMNADLQGVQFIDMPWLLKPDHAAVMVYPPSKRALSAELQRFYALGIDAFRVTQLLLERDLRSGESIDGVTGRISLPEGHHFQRELMPGAFEPDGSVKLLAQ